MRKLPNMFRFARMTFGAEHELADIPIDCDLPKGWGRDRQDITIVNSNGIANDPTGKLYKFGGELNTPPSETITQQVEHLQWIKRAYPMARINYRSNLHVHIRVPGLQDDLAALKRVQAYIHEHMPAAIEVLVPLPRPTAREFPHPQELQGALRRWKRRRVSHRTLLTPNRLQWQLQAASTHRFFEREVPRSKAGRTMWHAQPRLCVSLRQLLETDTVEFRHFPGTLDDTELFNCFDWCRRFMRHALENADIRPLLARARNTDYPSFPKYCHWQEVRYRATVHDGTVPRDQIKRNIELILAGEFDDQSASVVSR